MADSSERFWKYTTVLGDEYGSVSVLADVRNVVRERGSRVES